jgi:hypothetical protein
MSTANKLFGITDIDPVVLSHSRIPVKLNTNTNDKALWLLTVENNSEHIVFFNAIDGCVSFPRPNGSQDLKCDGVLRYKTSIHFVELKDRNGGAFVGDAIKQLKSTIDRFKKANDLIGFSDFKAQISNKQRPNFNNNTMILSQKFRNETDGFVLGFTSTISI